MIHERTATLTQADGRRWVISTREECPEPLAWVLKDIDGWIGDGVGVKAFVTDRLDHGNFPMRGYREGRTLTLTGAVLATDQAAADRAEREIANIMWSGEYGTLRVEESDSLTLSAQVRLDGTPQIDRVDLRRIRFSIPLASADSFLYADPRTSYGYPLGTGLGLVYPWFTGYYPPSDTRPPEVEPVIEWARTFNDLTDLPGTGTIYPNGGATLSITNEWASDGATSLKIGPGTSKGSAAYVLPRNSPLGQWAGRLVTVSGDIYLPQVQPDSAPTGGDPARSIHIGADKVDGGTEWGYASATVPPNTVGVHTPSITFLAPDDPEYWSGWFIRLYNGSQVVPVMWDRLTVSGLWVPIIEVERSVVMGLSRHRVAQSFDIDPVTSDYYVAQPRSYEEPVRRNLARNPEFTSMVGQFGTDTITGSSGATVALSRDWSAGSGTSLKITSNGDTGAAALLMPYTGDGRRGSSLAGKTIAVSADLYLPEPQGGTTSTLARTLGVGFVNASGSASTNDWSEPAPNIAGTHRVSMTVDVPAGTLAVYVYARNGATSGSIYVDRFMLEEIGEEGSSDGTYVPPELVVQNPLERTNLIPNGSFESGLNQQGTTHLISANTSAAVQDTAWALDGTRSVRIDPLTTGNGDSVFYPLGTTVPAIRSAGYFLPGQRYTVSATIRLTAAQTGSLNGSARRIRVTYWNGSSSTWAWAQSAAAPNVAGVHRVSLTFTTPAAVASAGGGDGVYIGLFNGSTNAPVWWDGLVIELGATDGSWFTSNGSRSKMAGASTAPVNLLSNTMTTSKQSHWFNGGEVGHGGGASSDVTTTPVGASSTSLRINAGSSYSSSVYMFSGARPIEEIGGTLATVTAKMRLTEPQTDDPVGTSSTPPRSLTAVGLPPAGSPDSAEYGMAVSNKAPNEAGTHDLSMQFIVPDAGTPYATWTLRVMNGSTTTPVYYSDVSLTAERLNRTEPGVVTTLGIPGDKVLQGIDVDPETGEWYVTQRAVNEVDLRVHRLRPNGELLETMTIPQGGHGGDMAIERDGADLYWWTYWPGRRERCRVRFRPGTVEITETEGIETLPAPHEYVRYSVNSAENIVAERTVVVGADGRERPRYRLYDLADYKAGTKTLLEDVTSTDLPLPSFQGFVVTREYIYEASGGTHGDPTAVFRFTWQLDRLGCLTSGWGEDETGYGEAEGICFGADGFLRVGKATGAPGSRVANVIAMDQHDAFDYVPSYVTPKVLTPYNGSNSDGYIRRVDENGAYLDSMLLPGAGHLNDMAVEHIDGETWVWVQWDEHPDRAARVRYRPGIVHPGDPGVIGIPVAGEWTAVDFSIWEPEGTVAVHRFLSPEHVYEVFDLEAYKAGERTVLRDRMDIPRSPHSWQGFTYDETYIYVHHGGSRHDPGGIWRYTWEGDVEDYQVLRDSGIGTAGGISRDEPEGITIMETEDGRRLVFGISGGDSKQRVASMHWADPSTQFDYQQQWEDAETPVVDEETPGGVLTYGEEMEHPEAVLENRGLADAYATAMVVGDFPGGVTITTGTSGRSLTYPWELVKESPLMLYGDGTAMIGDSDVTHLLSARGFSELQVAPGDTLTMYLEGLQGGTGYLQLAIQDTYV